MFTARKKIVKDGDAPIDAFEEQVAQAIFDLQVAQNDMKADLQDLYITSAKEVEVSAGRKAVIIHVPFRLLKSFHRIQQRLIRELEKKFSGKHVCIIAQRRILPREGRKNRTQKQKRPFSRTLTSVHESTLEDLVHPTEIVGKRTRIRVDGSKTLKVLLDPKDQANVEHKLDTFSTVYKSLTGRDATFEFPVAATE
mmetsp:Transcript_37336/g.88253  ORF Transcript_37336/g.88253 Transcript_37336/m.88253 type:complete len:196 (+) Transcript_37336:15-602(+)